MFCGTYSGLIIFYQFNYQGNSLSITAKKTLYIHSDEITDITANSFLNMFASVSKDGYLCLYTLPDLKLVRGIKISYFIKRYKLKNKVDNLQNGQINTKDNIKEKNENNKDSMENEKNLNAITEEKRMKNQKKTII